MNLPKIMKEIIKEISDRDTLKLDSTELIVDYRTLEELKKIDITHIHPKGEIGTIYGMSIKLNNKIKGWKLK